MKLEMATGLGWQVSPEYAVVRKIGKPADKTLSLGVSLKKHILTEEEVMTASKEL